MRELLLDPGTNCWRVERAERAAFLIDGQAYFDALRASLKRATRSIGILAWDIDSRVRLAHDDGDDGLPDTVGDFLNAVVASHPDLHAYVLTWDFAMLYAFEREWLPVFKFDWRTHRRLHFHMDDKHPPGASHHQKIVVVDDAVAFVGGFDLTRSRWDTPAHNPHDSRRVNPHGFSYAPFHDVQMIVDGEAAAALAQLVRERWQRATGQELGNADKDVGDCWPSEVHPDLTGVRVAIARTQSAYAGVPEVREVERLYVDAIAAAERYVYIENQYLTSSAIGDALAARLEKAHGPEVVLVLPKSTAGWLEQTTMDVLRARMLGRLRNADRHRRLRVYYPHIPDSGEEYLCVHGKVMVVDDAFVRVGSANLSNRSMALDSECDLAITANGEARTGLAIRRFRERLLGEHLSKSPATVAEALDASNSLIGAIERLRHSPRTLRELDGSVPPLLEQQIPQAAVIDPERPVDPERLAELFIPLNGRDPVAARGLRFVLIVVALLLTAAAWHWTPLRDYLDVDTVSAWLGELRHSAFGPLLGVVGFVLVSLLAVPVNLLIVLAALVFGPLPGFACSFVGAVLSAALAWAAGYWLGREPARRLAGSEINRLSRLLGRHGLISVITVRLLPVAPFSVVNMVAGASHVRLRDLLLGTAIGIMPALAGLTWFADRLYLAIRHPGPWTLAVLAAVALILALGGLLVWRWAARRESAGH